MSSTAWEDQDFWVARDGRVLKPEEFDDDHLVNTLKFIERSYESNRDAYEMGHDIEMLDLSASPLVDKDVSLEMVFDFAELDNLSVPQACYKSRKIYRLLYDEAVSRGLVQDISERELS